MITLPSETVLSQSVNSLFYIFKTFAKKWLIVVVLVLGYTVVAGQNSYKQKVYGFVQKQV